MSLKNLETSSVTTKNGLKIKHIFWNIFSGYLMKSFPIIVTTGPSQ